MAKYIIKRILYMVIVVFFISFIMYAIYNLIPYDRAATVTTETLKSDSFKNQIAQEGYDAVYNRLYLTLSREYGTDGNLFVRYLRWMGLYPFTKPDGGTGAFNGIFQGNFGFSYIENLPATTIMSEPMKNTILINIFATVLALGITIPLGIFCAVHKNKPSDKIVQVITIIGYSIPTFIIAILFIWLFSIVLGIFPTGYGDPQNFGQKLYGMCLPLIVMTFCSMGGMTRYVRSSMIESLSMDCIKTARAKGLKERTVIYSHAWRNALIPIVTLVVGWFLGIFSGSIVIEQLFGINGIGKLYIDKLNARDYEVVIALQMFYVIISLFGNLIIDLIYGLVDPRVRVSK